MLTTALRALMLSFMAFPEEGSSASKVLGRLGPRIPLQTSGKDIGEKKQAGAASQELRPEAGLGLQAMPALPEPLLLRLPF